MIIIDTKGQVSAEYLLLALVFLIILGSVTIPMISKAISSSQDVSSTSSIDATLNTVANAVGVVYANGPGAKRTINVYFPVGGTLTTTGNILSMTVPLSDGSNKVINANLPYTTTVDPNTVTAQTNYNATVTWTNGTNSTILVTLVPT